jgi:superoxide dismutase|nr:MAG TPA: Protein of unknown function (DUF3486) [Caudoviricetes sp.]
MAKRTRVKSKIDELPSEVRLVVDGMLADVRYTYREISEYLSEEGYDISYGSVFRYAQRKGNAAQRILEAQAQTKAIVDAIRQNPDMDYTEGALQMVASGLTQKIASASEEWDEMPMDKAVRAIISLSKTKSYKDKVYTELDSKIKTALDEFKTQVFEEIAENDPALATRIASFAEEFAGKIEDE